MVPLHIAAIDGILIHFTTQVLWQCGTMQTTGGINATYSYDHMAHIS
jgi:hypothetical protein